MATLTAAERTEIRRFVERYANANGIVITWTKAQINAAAQAAESLLSGDANIVQGEIAGGGGTGLPAVTAARMNTASSPFVFSAPLKQRIVGKVLDMKYIRDA